MHTDSDVGLITFWVLCIVVRGHWLWLHVLEWLLKMAVVAARVHDRVGIERVVGSLHSCVKSGAIVPDHGAIEDL